jgi:hypothetical protein
MTTVEITDIEQARQYFDFTRSRVLDVTAGLSEAQWRFKPAPDRWSIAENVEHMLTFHERVLGPLREMLANAPGPEAGRDNRKIDAIIFEKVPDRSIRVSIPIQLKGDLPLSEVEDRLAKNYARLLDFVESTPDLRQRVIESRPLQIVTEGAYTTADGYQWVLTAAAHDQRHVRQILEVKTDPNYPS